MLPMSPLDVLRIGRGRYVIHNHPVVCNPLSAEDLAFAVKFSLSGIEAVCADGTSDTWRPTP